MNTLTQAIHTYLTLNVLFAVAAGLAVLALCAGIEKLLNWEDPVFRRLLSLSRGGGCGRGKTLKESFFIFVKKAFPADEKKSHVKTKTQKNLIMAGYRSPDAFSAFTAVRICFMVLAPLAAAFILNLTGAEKPKIIMAACFLGVVAMILPSYLLEKKVAVRIKRITRELPDVMDLLVIAVEAGLGLPAAVKRVASELSASCPVLAEEMKILSLEMKVGVPRDEALRNFADRTGADDVSSLVTMLIQADRFGVSVGQSLRVHSEEVRTKKRQRLEEEAAKIPLKLLFPVLFLIFPAIMAAMAGPAVITIMETMF